MATTGATTPWKGTPMGPPDAILGLTDAFRADTSADKVNLGVGAYRDDAGRPFVLSCVREAESRLERAHMDKEYAGIAGVPSFVDAAVELAYGDAAPRDAIAAVQSISGTGALRVGAEMIRKFAPGAVYLPVPTWGNHGAIFGAAGLEVRTYRYYSAATHGLDCEGMLADLGGAPAGSWVVLHACAHNPTGVDPSAAQWTRIHDAIVSARLNVLFDMAYQGFATGRPDDDAAAVRLFAREKRVGGLLLAQSFAKNMGLYGERVGTLSAVCADAAERDRVLSQLKITVRAMYSNPPVHGARIAAAVLGDAGLRALWHTELALMADRIAAMRTSLRRELEALSANVRDSGIESDKGARNTARSWAHITEQVGMFCYTGMSAAQVARVRETHHVYMTADGRVSIAGLTTANVKHVAAGIHAAVSRP